MELDWQAMRASAGPFPPQAFAFVQEGLRYTVESIRSHEPELPEHGRHVSGQELCIGLRDYAISQYGLLARTVLERWHVRKTEDFGRIVFAMVEAGFMRKTDEDSFEDFKGVFEFDECFENVETPAPAAGGA